MSSSEHEVGRGQISPVLVHSAHISDAEWGRDGPVIPIGAASPQTTFLACEP